MQNISLENALLDKLKQRGKVSRQELRNYGENIRTINAPYGYDVASIDRKLRKLDADGHIIAFGKNGMCFDNQYITHYVFAKWNDLTISS